MVNKSVATEEILRMIAEISTSLDRLEISYGETVNTVRCKLWAEQYTLVNDAQEAIEKAEEYWVNTEGENHSFSFVPEKSIRTHNVLTAQV
ncbi:hypothetical protein SRABI96_01560 [Peribacillus sp. Bi96]|uniref:hypothetical protein n=1 Tax=unclassified Peribacillus TaxID=2675266 RepID=UPI001D83FE74|nr:hypothetical protein [Peribacillus sp. Bi96]CAH0186299.1 hypothetical protein SRABI96_01560 [Peribacillus sp. Bi96]